MVNDFVVSSSVEAEIPSAIGSSRKVDSDRKWRLVSVSLLLLACLATGAAGDNRCLPCVLSNATLALAGTFAYPPGPCSESVWLSGNVRVATKVEPKTSVANVDMSLAGVSGVGQNSRDVFIAMGSSEHTGIALPPGPNTFTATFTLEPTNGCVSVPLPLNFALNFNGDGSLNAAASSVTVGGRT